jgi:hypothetical protein
MSVADEIPPSKFHPARGHDFPIWWLRIFIQNRIG